MQSLTFIPEDAIKGKAVDDSYLAENFPVTGGRLTIALSRAQLVDMGEVFLTVLVISLLPALAISATVGLFFARHAKARIGAIGDTLQRFGLGDLSARVALTLDRLQNRTDLSPNQAGYVTPALDETDCIAKTFNALLRILQSEGGALRDRFQPVDLGALAADFIDVFEASAEESGYSLRLSANAGAMVAGDRDLLGQVIANLIENGLRHVPAGGEIAVKVEPTPEGVVLRVADNGRGNCRSAWRGIVPVRQCAGVGSLAEIPRRRMKAPPHWGGAVVKKD